MWRKVLVAVALCVPGACLLAADQLQRGKLVGFDVREARFDESMGNKLPTPLIPKAWRFVGVANGEHANSNTLWFQDADGTVYCVTGFHDAGKFIIGSHIHKIGAEQ